MKYYCKNYNIIRYFTTKNEWEHFTNFVKLFVTIFTRKFCLSKNSCTFFSDLICMKNQGCRSGSDIIEEDRIRIQNSWLRFWVIRVQATTWNTDPDVTCIHYKIKYQSRVCMKIDREEDRQTDRYTDIHTDSRQTDSKWEWNSERDK